jgi:hypothetical protein
VTARQPRHRTLAAPARFAARWRELAACRGIDPEVFFPGRGETAGPARRVCAACPVRQSCLEYARSGRLAGRLTGRALGHGAWLIQVQLERGGLRVLAQAESRMTS